MFPIIDLIAVDLDGTLLNSNRLISHENELAIQDAQNLGIEVVLASGRMYRNLYFFQHQLGLASNSIIGSNGAEVRGQNGLILHQALLNKQIKEKVINLSRQYNIHLNAYTHEELWFLKDDTWGDIYLSRVHPSKRKIVEPDDIIVFEIVKLLLVADPESITKFHDAEGDKLEKLGTKITKSEPDYLEFLPPNTSKGTGLETISKLLKIPPARIAAIGDYFNDLEMLEFAGFAIAMMNAPDEIKSLAQYITSTNDENGVAKAINLLCEAKRMSISQAEVLR